MNIHSSSQKNLYSLMLGTISCSAILLSACGSGLKAGGGVADGAPQQQSTAPASGSTPTANQIAWEKLSMDGTPEAGGFKLFQVVTIDKTTKELVLKLPMPANPFIDGLNLAPIEIPQLPGSHLGIEPIASGGSTLTFRVPLRDLIKKEIDFPTPTSLPNGDPLPKVADGSLPSAAISINDIKKINATLYFSVQQLGIFVNTPFDPFIGSSLAIKNADHTRTWGYLTSIPAKKAPAPAMDGGFFISIVIPDDIARIIDDNL